MKFTYGEFDGDEFPTQDSLFGKDQLMNMLMRHGDDAMDALQQMMENPEQSDPDIQEFIEKMLKEGQLEKDESGKLRLTPKAVTGMQQKALLEVFENLDRGNRDGHRKVTPGPNGERIDGTKPYQFGDSVSDLDLHATLHNALHRHGLPDFQNGGRLQFGERDMELHQHEGTTSVSTVVLLDMSGSMMRYGRWHNAKKVAMAMSALVRQKFPQDTIDFVGFYSGGEAIKERDLPLAMPKPVTIYDYEVRLKVPIDKIDKAPQHFTNLHMGLQIARRILKRKAADTKQLFIITDGQPTAHIEGKEVFLLYPPDPRSTAATLKEALLARREGCRFATFALVEDYWGMDWVGFVDQLTKLTKGVSFYTASGELSNCVMESYLSGRKKKSFIA
ncbi:MAG: VWA domain-containing protein [Planctomycetota bacterium]